MSGGISQIIISLEPDNDKERKSYPCSFPGCFKTYTRASRLMLHINYFHLRKEKPNICSVCSKRFMENSALVFHMRCH